MCCMMMHAMDHSEHVQASHGEAPLDILQRRFALGEISAQEFEEMKGVLGLGTSSTSQGQGTGSGRSPVAEHHR